MHGKELVIQLFHPIVQNKIKTPAKIEHYCLANAPSTSVRERIGFTVKLLVSLTQGGEGGGRGGGRGGGSILYKFAIGNPLSVYTPIQCVTLSLSPAF